MTDRYDVIVVGGGHNGLVCATLLARRGRSVLILEANERPGGAAVTRPLGDGCRVPACAHLLYRLQDEVVASTGARMPEATEISTVALAADGRHLRLDGERLAGAGADDEAAYAAFRRQMQRYADLLNRQFNRVPPRLADADIADRIKLGRFAGEVRRLGRDDMREFLRLLGSNIHDEVVERFADRRLRGAIALDAVLGTHLGPRSPSTLFTYLHRLAGGRLSLPSGGIDAVIRAFVNAARDAGVEIRTACPVGAIEVAAGRVAGVRMRDGERIESPIVVSNADPKRTVLDLVGARHFETRFIRRIDALRGSGNAAKLHLVLDGRPEIPGVDEGEHRHRFIVAPDEDYVERAFNPAKYGEYSPEPVIELILPGVHDPTIRTAGRHVVSAIVQFAPARLAGGWTDAARQAFVDTVTRTLTRYLPDLPNRIVTSELLLPGDIEAQFHVTGGHWHHAELAFDQFMFARPVVGASRYRLPIPGLYLCGAGSHPGGGISGAPGRNAAHAVLAGEGRQWR